MNLEYLKDLKPNYAFLKSESVEAHEKERSVTHYISTPDLDWGGDIVDPKGMDDTMFKKHNTVFYNHDYNTPIAKNLWLKKTDEGVLAKTQMGKTLFADDIYQLQKDGIINTWSIGWRPKMKDGKRDKDAIEIDEDKGITYINKWDLIEYSVAPLAMNPSALDKIKSMAKSFEVKGIVRDYEIEQIAKTLVNEHNKELDSLNKMFTEYQSMLEGYDARIEIMESEIKILQDTLQGNIQEEAIEILGADDVRKHINSTLEKLVAERKMS